MDNLLRQTKHTAITFALLLAGQAMLTAQEKNAAPAAKPAQTAKTAQQAPPPPPVQPAKAPQEQPPLPPQLERNVTTKLFTIEHRNPEALLPILKGFQSNLALARIDANILGDLKLLTVRDLPANIALIEKVLETLDVPEEKARAFELTINLLWASKKDFKGDPVPSSLSDVVSSVSETMSYKFFREAGTIKCRMSADGQSVSGNGQLDDPSHVNVPSYQLVWHLAYPMVDGDGVLSGKFNCAYSSSRIEGAAVSLYEGQKTVIGTTLYREFAMIVVLSIESI
jgi:hypothetical protein